MQSDVARMVRQEGFAFLRRFEPSKDAAQVVRLLGELDALGADGSVHELKPATIESSTPNTYSGNYGFGVFPLHTDMAHWQVPPRFLLLRCVIGSKEVSTSLLDGIPIVRKVGEAVLTRALVKPRRPLLGKRSLLRVYENNDGEGRLRWDDKYILAATPAGQAGMQGLREALGQVRHHDIYLIDPGDTLLIDNWRMLHGRGSVTPDASNRTITRAYLKSIH